MIRLAGDSEKRLRRKIIESGKKKLTETELRYLTKLIHQTMVKGQAETAFVVRRDLGQKTRMVVIQDRHDLVDTRGLILDMQTAVNQIGKNNHAQLPRAIADYPVVSVVRYDRFWGLVKAKNFIRRARLLEEGVRQVSRPGLTVSSYFDKTLKRNNNNGLRSLKFKSERALNKLFIMATVGLVGLVGGAFIIGVTLGRRMGFGRLYRLSYQGLRQLNGTLQQLPQYIRKYLPQQATAAQEVKLLEYFPEHAAEESPQGERYEAIGVEPNGTVRMNKIPKDAAADGKSRAEVEQLVKEEGGIKAIVTKYGLITRDRVRELYEVDEAVMNKLKENVIFIRGPPSIGVANHVEDDQIYILIPEGASRADVLHDINAVIHYELTHQQNIPRQALVINTINAQWHEKRGGRDPIDIVSFRLVKGLLDIYKSYPVKIRLYKGLPISGDTRVAVVILQDGQVLSYEADLTEVRAYTGTEDELEQENESLDWEWIEQEYNKKKIEAMLQWAEPIKRIAMIKAAYDIYVQRVMLELLSEEDRNVARTGAFFTAKYGRPVLSSIEGLISTYLMKLNREAKDITLETRRKLVLAVYQVAMKKVGTAPVAVTMDTIIEKLKLDAAEISEELIRELLTAVYVVAAQKFKQYKELKNETKHKVVIVQQLFDEFIQNLALDVDSISEEVKQQLIIAVYAIAMKKINPVKVGEMIQEFVTLLDMKVGQMSEELIKKTIIAVYNVVKRNISSETVRALINVYVTRLDINVSEMSEDMLKHLIIAVYALAINDVGPDQVNAGVDYYLEHHPLLSKADIIMKSYAKILHNKQNNKNSSEPNAAPYLPLQAAKDDYSAEQLTAKAVIEDEKITFDAVEGTITESQEQAAKNLFERTAYLAHAPPVVITSDFTKTGDAIAAYNAAEKVLYIHLFVLDILAGLTKDDKATFLLFLQGVLEGHEAFHIQGLDEEQARQETLRYLRTHADVLAATLKVLNQTEIFAIEAVDKFAQKIQSIYEQQQSTEALVFNSALPQWDNYLGMTPEERYDQELMIEVSPRADNTMIDFVSVRDNELSDQLAQALNEGLSLLMVQLEKYPYVKSVVETEILGNPANKVVPVVLRTSPYLPSAAAREVSLDKEKDVAGVTIVLNTLLIEQFIIAYRRMSPKMDQERRLGRLWSLLRPVLHELGRMNVARDAYQEEIQREWCDCLINRNLLFAVDKKKDKLSPNKIGKAYLALMGERKKELWIQAYFRTLNEIARWISEEKLMRSHIMPHLSVDHDVNMTKIAIRTYLDRFYLRPSLARSMPGLSAFNRPMEITWVKGKAQTPAPVIGRYGIYDEDDLNAWLKVAKKFKDTGFILLAQLGIGNYGRVYLVQNTNNPAWPKRVAVKVDRIYKKRSTQAIKASDEIMELGNNLSFVPSIIRVFAGGKLSAKYTYHVLEMVDGAELDALISIDEREAVVVKKETKIQKLLRKARKPIHKSPERQKRLQETGATFTSPVTLNQVLALFIGIMRLVEDVHALRYTINDLKTGNMMISRRGLLQGIDLDDYKPASPFPMEYIGDFKNLEYALLLIVLNAGTSRKITLQDLRPILEQGGYPAVKQSIMERWEFPDLTLEEGMPILDHFIRIFTMARSNTYAHDRKMLDSDINQLIEFRRMHFMRQLVYSGPVIMKANSEILKRAQAELNQIAPKDASAEGKSRAEIERLVRKHGGIHAIQAEYGTIVREQVYKLYQVDEARLSRLADNVIFVRGPPEIGVANHVEGGTFIHSRAGIRPT